MDARQGNYRKAVLHMRRSNLWLVGLFASVATLFVAWQQDESDNVDTYQKLSLHVAPVAGTPASHSTASSLSPFSSLTCKLANGERVNTTACNPDSANRGDASDLDDARPDVRAQSALSRIEAREFDKLHVLASSFSDCWFVHAPSLDQRKPLDQQVASGCDFALVERLVDKAQSAIKTASSQGDHVAREAYVDLLVTKIGVNQSQLELYDRTSKDPDAISGVEKLEAKIDADRSQIVSFVQSLNEPSEYLKDSMATAAQLREIRNESGNAPPQAR